MDKYSKELLERSENLDTANVQGGKLTCESPSNIAIVKYWGKKDNQIPQNPSISFSLDKSKTKTTIEYKPKTGNSEMPQIKFLFEGKENEKFQSRIEKFINSVIPFFPFLKFLDLTIHSENTFPHSTGIASSASSLSSIALCLCSIENALFGNLSNKDEFLKKASFISRLGSGSAARSVYSKWAIWGKSKSIKNSSNEYATPLMDINPDFNQIKDTVLLVSSTKKPISSSAGHEMMNNHDYSASRIEQANRNCAELYSVLKSGDLVKFIEIAENEALTLHALMMTSNPGYLLLQPNSLVLIEKIRAFRKETKLPVGFTIDAGPNIHLLYFEKDKKQVDDFIKSELVNHCENGGFIDDGILS